MTKIKNKTVLVTGGANGIGKLMGLRCLEEGAKALIIWDINPQKLDETTREFRNKGYTVHPYLVDVADVEDIEQNAKEVLDKVGIVDILFNNAGIVVGKSFDKHTVSDIEKTIRINVLGVMHVARVFLPEMLNKRAGHIVNIASAAGLTANPNMSVYASSKWAVLGWSDSLRLELERKGRKLHVTTVTPSYINTGMFKGAKAPLLTPIVTPESIVKQIINAVKRNQIIVRAPSSVNLLPLAKGVLPTRMFDFVADKVFGIYHSMDEFQGRPEEEAVPSKEKLMEKFEGEAK